MTTTARRMRPDDIAWMVELIDANRAENLTPDEARRGGFVQGVWNLDNLSRWPDDPGTFIAEVGGERAGLCINSPVGHVRTPVARRTNELALEHFGQTCFLYGPVVVDARFRGAGVLRTLVRATFEAARGRYAHAIAFIEASNDVSRTVHDRLGFTTFATFTHEGREFLALACDVG